jgi:hypothetical protein
VLSQVIDDENDLFKKLVNRCKTLVRCREFCNESDAILYTCFITVDTIVSSFTVVQLTSWEFRLENRRQQNIPTMDWHPP